MMILWLFFFNDTATTEIYTLSLHDALPIYPGLRLATPIPWEVRAPTRPSGCQPRSPSCGPSRSRRRGLDRRRSEEHTSELQSRPYLVCLLLLEKKKKPNTQYFTSTPLLPVF